MSSCEFVKQNGEPCHAPALRGSQLCYWHDPALATQRAEARKKGGINRRVSKRSSDRRYSIRAVDDVLTVLEDALNDVVGLENSHSRARTIGYLSGIALKAIEVGELENRVAALEKRLDQQKKWRGG